MPIDHRNEYKGKKERTVEAIKSRTQSNQVELRKNKRDELLAKRRNLLEGGQEEAGSSASTADGL